MDPSLDLDVDVFAEARLKISIVVTSALFHILSVAASFLFT
jgi:hypothetical protein